MMIKRLQKLVTACLVTTVIFGCGETLESPAQGTVELKDSGWLASDSYEVNAMLTGVVRQEATGDWADLEFDESLQAKLVDQQDQVCKEHGGRKWMALQSTC